MTPTTAAVIPEVMIDLHSGIGIEPAPLVRLGEFRLDGDAFDAEEHVNIESVRREAHVAWGQWREAIIAKLNDPTFEMAVVERIAGMVVINSVLAAAFD